MMVRRLALLLSVSCILASASGCSTWRKLNNTEKGAVLGAATGIVIGASSAGATGALVGGAAGAFGGAVIGRETR